MGTPILHRSAAISTATCREAEHGKKAEHSCTMSISDRPHWSGFNPRGDPGNLEFVAGNGPGRARETEGGEARGQIDREAKTVRGGWGEFFQSTCLQSSN